MGNWHDFYEAVNSMNQHFLLQYKSVFFVVIIRDRGISHYRFGAPFCMMLMP